MARFYSEIEAALNEAGIPEADRAAFRPAFPGDTDPALTRRETELKHALAERQGALDNPAEATIRWLQAQIEELMKQESADKARQERIKTIQTRIAQRKGCPNH